MLHVGIFTNNKIREQAIMITLKEVEIRSRLIKDHVSPVRLMIIDALKECELSFSKINEMFESLTPDIYQRG
jgi:hypothetical protein